MFQINRPPVGVDDVLGAKSWPTFQGQLAEQVVTIYDATRQYLLAKQRTTSYVLAAGLSAAGAGGFQSLTASSVPNDEAWLIVNFTMSVTIAGASTVGWFRPAIVLNPQLTALRAVCPSESGPVATGGNDTRYVGWEPNLWIPPGSFFAIAYGAVTTGGGNPSVAGSVTYVPVKV